MYKTHIAFGLFFGYIISLFVPVTNVYNYLIFCILGSLLPDIDHEKSYISNKLFGISKIISSFFGHRGFFHSIFPPMILYSIFYFMDLHLVGLGLFVGYFSHLLSDALTVSGINFLYPASKFQLKGFFVTNGVLEYVFFVVLSILDGYLLKGFIF